jgi:hypothetical protein
LPYIKTELTEINLFDGIISLITANGWTLVERFKKAAYSSMYCGNSYSYQPDTIVDFAVAEHIIFENALGNKFGMARVWKNQTLKMQDLPADIRSAMSAFNQSSKTIADVHDFIINLFDPDEISIADIYFYMLKDFTGVQQPYISANTSNTVNDSLDIENLSGEPININGYGKWDNKYTQPQNMQSPIVQVKLRSNALNGNWWPDSKVRVEGLVSDETVFLLIQCDNAAAYEGAEVPVVPVYFGQIEPLSPTDTMEPALWAGSAPTSKTYDYSNPNQKFVTNPIFPFGKTYPKNPGNGIDDIIVRRTKYGAYYQAYYLAWQTGPEAMPPNRQTSDGKQYPSAWKNQQNDEYAFRFNPSSYTKRIHVSRAYVIHPEEGVKGFLRDTVMLSPIGLINGDRMRLKKAACPNVYEIYKYHVVDAVSPMTKRPATAYRPAALGIFEKEE